MAPRQHLNSEGGERQFHGSAQKTHESGVIGGLIHDLPSN